MPITDYKGYFQDFQYTSGEYVPELLKPRDYKRLATGEVTLGGKKYPAAIMDDRVMAITVAGDEKHGYNNYVVDLATGDVAVGCGKGGIDLTKRQANEWALKEVVEGSYPFGVVNYTPEEVKFAAKALMARANTGKALPTQEEGGRWANSGDGDYEY